MIADVSLFFGADSIPDDYGKDFVPIPDDGLTEDDIWNSDSEANTDDILALMFGDDSESVVKG